MEDQKAVTQTLSMYRHRKKHQDAGQPTAVWLNANLAHPETVKRWTNFCGWCPSFDPGGCGFAFGCGQDQRQGLAVPLPAMTAMFVDCCVAIILAEQAVTRCYHRWWTRPPARCTGRRNALSINKISLLGVIIIIGEAQAVSKMHDPSTSGMLMRG
jgi:K+-transporting ATPase A subunit